MARRRELFPPDRALQVRMVLALAVQAVLVVAVIAAIAWTAVKSTPWVLIFLIGLPVGGFIRSVEERARRERGKSSRPDWDAMEQELRGAVQRLALQGGLKVPEVVLEPLVPRHRELAADRAAAVLTGSPAGVAAALMAVTDGLGRVPTRDPFHFVPVRGARGVRRLWATHPRLDRRIARLERLEQHLQDNAR